MLISRQVAPDMVEVEVRFVELLLDTGASGDATNTVNATLRRLKTGDTVSLSDILENLNRNGSVNSLSAPKAAMRLGEEGTMKVVRTFVYPTTVAAREMTVTNQAGVSPVEVYQGVLMAPAGYVTNEEGVSMTVLPLADRENRKLILNIKAGVNELQGWKQQEAIFVAKDGKEKKLSLSLPVIATRAVCTRVSMEDGTTIVLGSDHKEFKTEIEDKVPVFGSVPLIGRFFRSRQIVVQWRHWLVLVTARLVDYRGQPCGWDHEAGEENVP
ncbi:MAG: hypothetical protein HY343_09280 [Lentisphaerae bacterium]|nr:hypothetical protein [Lentisphaerota bacterium]